MKIGLVACGARKLSNPAPAHELYTGVLFRLSAACAEQTCDRWYILSAKYGLVSPDRVLSPYNVTLNNMPIQARREWAERVLGTLDALGPNNDNAHWLILAGRRYREFLIPGLRGTVEIPLAGLGIGQQIARLKLLLE